MTPPYFAAGHDWLDGIDPSYDPAQPARGGLDLWDALVYSAGAFFTVGFGTMEPVCRGARIMTVVESALGIGLFALLLFTLGNRISRS